MIIFSNQEEKSRELAYMVYRLFDGDSVDNALDRLKDMGYVDENYEWLYD